MKHMSEFKLGTDAIVRAILGIFAGAVLGASILGGLSPFLSYDPWSHGFGLLFVSAGTGAMFGCGLGGWAGNRRLRGKTLLACVGIVVGILLGALGGVLYGAAAVASVPQDALKRGAMEIHYRALGIGVGVPAGCLIGGICGWASGFIVSRKNSTGTRLLTD
jgi:hypothetical protein